MWQTLLLVLPVLVPSWRFFKTIEPSPRIEWRFAEESAWRTLRPLPQRLSPWQMAARLFYNPVWNEGLFLVSCAERIQEVPTPHSITTIQRAIRQDITAETAAREVVFRIRLIARQGEEMVEEVLFVSDPFSSQSGAAF